MTKSKPHPRSTETEGGHVDAVSITTSHSFQQKERQDIREAIAQTPVYNLSHQSKRRDIGKISTNDKECQVEFHIESTDVENQSQYNEFSDRPDFADTLRVKIIRDLSRSNSTPEKELVQCLQNLNLIESSIGWLDTDSLLSITYYLGGSSDTGYQHDSIGDISVVLFDGKLRVRRVYRDKLNAVIDEIARHRESDLNSR